MTKLKQTTAGACLLLALLLSGCAAGTTPIQTSDNSFSGANAQEAKRSDVSGLPFDIQVNPEDFSVSFQMGDNLIPISEEMEPFAVSDYKQEGRAIQWRYPEEGIAVSITPAEDYLSVQIRSETTEDNSWTWPKVSAENYYLPLGEGKFIPAQEENFRQYLSGQEFSVMEQLSMPFWAASFEKYTVVYILEDPYRTELNFAEDGPVSFSVEHSYPAIDANKENRYRIYITENDPVKIAKLYRNYVIEKGKFVTLEQKAEQVADIRKLYGAPFIYLWGSFLISDQDIRWQAFREAVDSPVLKHLLTFTEEVETGKEFQDTIAEIKTQDYVGDYQKNSICDYLSRLLTRKDFIDLSVFTHKSAAVEQLLQKGMDNLSESEIIWVNKTLLAENLPEVFQDAATWMNRETTDVIRQLKDAGIDKAWIGLTGWEQAFAKPELVDVAVEQGFLIGSYDSYHSIHEPGKEQWSTAQFTDTSLYDNATISDNSGKKISGFQNVGRKLNPTLALPSVKERLKNIIEKNDLPFPSWFIDCDATGEIYDDYSPGHITTQQQDLAARLERMAYIRDTYHMVIGSEGGNDYAAATIAFAHGLELKSFSWMDRDMKENKESEYYIGKYFNATGGVAEHFAKRIPIKSNYYTVFTDPRYDVPLFKLVYNDSLITSYHWDWSTFKIKGATQERMLREVLYNVPPLYHLDGAEWERYKDDIVRHTSIWSEFSEAADTLEMTDFKKLSQDGSVQMTQFGEDIRVIVNFTDTEYQHGGQTIPGKSAQIENNGRISIYTPQVSPDNL